LSAEASAQAEAGGTDSASPDSSSAAIEGSVKCMNFAADLAILSQSESGALSSRITLSI
jgi:hypothetical protein